MDPNETMVEENFGEGAADDALLENFTEEEQDESEDLQSLMGEGEPANEQQGQEPPATEPGWIKKRVNKAVEKAVAETERRMTAEFERQMAPIREKMLNDEAKALVQQGEFKSVERAKEYLQLKQGMTPAPVSEQQPRNEQGRFAPKNDPVIEARIELLANQADKIKDKTGIDVMAEFNSDLEIKNAVLSGEMDFYEVAEQMKQSPKKRPPAPMRSPNGASNVITNPIMDMSDEQFRKLNQRLDEGARISMKH